MNDTSHDSNHPIDTDNVDTPGCSVVEQCIVPRDKDLGGFSVRRCLPTIGRKSVGPWVFFDHFGPVTLAPGPGTNVRPHPHVNLATVSYLFAGEILHRDSLGTMQLIHPGDINLMVAGRGIVHSERERPQATLHERPLHGLQLWLALPQADEEMNPVFLHYPSADIPALSVDGVPVRVMMGTAYGANSPVRVFAHTLYIEAELQAGQSLLLPEAPERAVYVAQGQVQLGSTTVDQHAMAVLRNNSTGVTLQARVASRVALIGGEHLGQRFIDWNFVSSRKERIEQAKQDWREGRFPKVPGDETEFIPLPQ
ncbi:MAG: pirin family protein [Burkholderiaceae bacterium]